jgi:hypothetical protein
VCLAGGGGNGSGDGDGGAGGQLARLEQEVYEWHLQVYDIQLEYLQEEEKLYQHQRNCIRASITGKEQWAFSLALSLFDSFSQIVFL